MLYKVTNNSATLKALASAVSGETHFVKPDTTVALDLKPLSHDQLKKFAKADLICEVLATDEDADMDKDSAPLTKAQKAAAKKAESVAATTAPDAPATAPVAPAPAPEPAPAPGGPVTEPTPAPEPWQKGLEPPK